MSARGGVSSAQGNSSGASHARVMQGARTCWPLGAHALPLRHQVRDAGLARSCSRPPTIALKAAVAYPAAAAVGMFGLRSSKMQSFLPGSTRGLLAPP